jgi:hypothetical protein
MRASYPPDIHRVRLWSSVCLVLFAVLLVTIVVLAAVLDVCMSWLRSHESRRIGTRPLRAQAILTWDCQDCTRASRASCARIDKEIAELEQAQFSVRLGLVKSGKR